jgi:ABC-type transport system involved in multi-copper enzyme maturation permease subunit
MEFTATARLWWIRLCTVAYALATVAMASASGVIGESEPAEGFARLTVAVLPLALMLVPLATLLVVVSSVAGSEETGFLLAQPVSRRHYLLGRWLGQAVAVSTSIVAGFGTGGVLVWSASGAADVHRFVMLIAACLLTALAFLSIATLVGSLTSRRAAAVGVAAFIWFFAVILYDAIMLAIALWASGTAGARVLFLSVFGNVVDLVRVLTLLLAGTPHVLGAAGESWLRGLGGSGTAIALSATAIAFWIVAPLIAAARIQATRDV